jgi:glucose/arabinose dehydrogenase
VNGFSIYGTRGGAGKDGSGEFNNRMVMEREREILDQMCALRDDRIWGLAQGKKFTEPVNDDSTLPFFEPTTNVGIPNDPNAKRGKLGTLKYLTAKEQEKKFDLPPGYEINLVASEEDFPELANPVAINFDNKGRLWVATMASYPQWKPKTKLDDKILIFEDDDADGRADRCKVFADGLHQPTGFEIGDGGVYIAQQPDILFVKDTDGDDKADFSERRLVGFDSADSHHGIAAFQWGPGGVLYFQEGTFKFSQVESPYGLTRCREAGVWKYNTRTEKVGVHTSFSFSNPWGHIFIVGVRTLLAMHLAV